MRGRAFLTALLTLVFCLTAVFPVGAAQPTAKDLVLNAVKNFDLGINQGFYEQSYGEANITVTRFGGSLSEVLGDYSGSKIRLFMTLDDSQKAMKLSYNTDIKGLARGGEVYILDDKIVLTKDLFYLLQDFGVDVFEHSDFSLAEAPKYLYLTDPQFKAVWEQLADYQNRQLPEEYTELLLFLVEAIPDECFRLSPAKVTIQLDQDGLVNTIINLLTKMNNESERFAEIMVGANRHSFEQMGMDPEEMKREMADSMKDMPVPTREEVQAVMSLVEVKDFTFEYSLLPGGPKKFNVDLGFNAPDDSAKGSLAFSMDMAGKQNNLQGSYRLAGGFSAVDGPGIDFAYDGKSSYADTVAHSEFVVNMVARDNKTGDLMLDFGLTGDSVSKVDPNLDLDVPVLASENSVDITEVITMGPAVTNEPMEPDLRLVVNGVELKAKAGIGKQGELVVPARAVLEQLGCEVIWVEPDEVRIVADDEIISLFINQNRFTVNGAERRLTVPPFVEAGTAMVPLEFVIDHIGAGLTFADRSLVITN